jgi:hypothetical protein
MRTLSCEPGTEVSGASMRSFVESITADEYAPLVKKYGYENVDPDGWYPLSSFHDFLNELIQHPNGTPNLVSLGLSIAKVALTPPELKNPTFAQVVEGWDLHYQANFRKGPVGHKTTVKVDDRHYKIVLDRTAMPDDLEYGVLYGFAKRFLPSGSHFKVWYDDKVVRMDEGGEQTVIHVSWD